MSPARRRRCIDHVRRELAVSERRACRVLGQYRSTQRKVPRGADDERALTEDILALAKQYGRYGYRRVTALLRDAGWTVNRTLLRKIEPALDDIGARAELTTVRHLLRFARVRIEGEGQSLSDEVDATRPLLAQIAAYHDAAGDASEAEAIRAALAAAPAPDRPGYRSLDDLTEEVGALRDALRRALAALQALRPGRHEDTDYLAIRAEIRAHIVHQIEAEGRLVAPAFFGRGPRR